MSPLDAPVAYVLLAISLLVLLGAAVIANVRHHKTPTPTRPGSANPRVGAGPKCVACGKPAVKAVRAGLTSWLMCGRCREEYDALSGRAS